MHIRITCKEINPNTIRIEVKDNGMGITPEALKHIFKRYHRGDHQNDMKINGHGQGLYFARMVVQAHRGSIAAESVVGTGTTFKELSKKAVDNLEIAIPPLELQEQFECIYHQSDKSKLVGHCSMNAMNVEISKLINKKISII